MWPRNQYTGVGGGRYTGVGGGLYTGVGGGARQRETRKQTQ